MSSIQIATDGSCIQQGGFAKGDATDRPGASGFVARMPDGTMVGKATPYANGTIGEMEIKGLRMGLEFAAAVASRTEDRIRIKCDSQFVVNGFNDWLSGWAAKGYHKKGGLTGAEDWRAIDAIKKSLGDRVSVVWVKGHSGDPLNERVDGIVNSAARSQKDFDDTQIVLGSDAIAKAPSGLNPAATLAVSDEENARRLHDYVAGTLPAEPTSDRLPAVLEDFSPIEHPDAVLMMSASASGTGRSIPDRNRKIFDITGQPSPIPPKGGLHAQAAVLLSKAADDPRLARLLAQGLDMALEQSRTTSKHDRETLDQATILQAVLEKRGTER